MEKNITETQKLILKDLTKMSNMISNAVWMAENTDSDVEGQIDLAIWAAKHFCEVVEAERMTS